MSAIRAGLSSQPSADRTDRANRCVPRRSDRARRRRRSDWWHFEHIAFTAHVVAGRHSPSARPLLLHSAEHSCLQPVALRQQRLPRHWRVTSHSCAALVLRTQNRRSRERRSTMPELQLDYVLEWDEVVSLPCSVANSRHRHSNARRCSTRGAAPCSFRVTNKSPRHYLRKQSNN